MLTQIAPVLRFLVIVGWLPALIVHVQPDYPPSLWVPKVQPLPIIRQQCDFRILMPQMLPSRYVLLKSQVDWAVRIRDINAPYNRIPSRRLVRLLYVKPGTPDTFSLVEAKHQQGIRAFDSLTFAVGQGYFHLPVHVGKTWVVTSGGRSGTDYVIFSTTLPQQDAAQMCRHLG